MVFLKGRKLRCGNSKGDSKCLLSASGKFSKKSVYVEDKMLLLARFYSSL